MVGTTNAIIDPYTMMIRFLYTRFTERAVFGPRRFGCAAGGAEIAWVEEEVVVWEGVHCFGVDGAKGEVGSRMVMLGG